MSFIVILFLMFVSGAEIDICVPSFPDISKQFLLSPFRTELLLSVNLIFHCLSSLYVGKLSDRYGKKNTIKCGLIIFIAASFCAYISNSYYMLLLARAIQGAGIAATIVLAPIIVLDLYKKDRHTQIMTSLNGFYTLAIAAAPTIGSYTTLYFGWRFNFLLLCFLSLVALLLLEFKIKDKCSSRNNNKLNNISILQLIKEYIPLFQGKSLYYITALSLSIGSYYGFVAMAPIIYIQSFGISLKSFGLYQGSLTIVFAFVSIFSGFFEKAFGKKKYLILSSFLVIIFLILSFILIFLNIKNPMYITIVFAILSIGCAYPINVLYVSALQSSDSGKMSALLTIGKWLSSIFTFQISSYFYSHDIRSTLITILMMYTIAIISIIAIVKNDKEVIKF
jgi:DHA1 family bicyclomycin/chloramphenicol resistance-like MFS transporter